MTIQQYFWLDEPTLAMLNEAKQITWPYVGKKPTRKTIMSAAISHLLDCECEILYRAKNQIGKRKFLQFEVSGEQLEQFERARKKIRDKSKILDITIGEVYATALLCFWREIAENIQLAVTRIEPPTNKRGGSKPGKLYRKPK